MVFYNKVEWFSRVFRAVIFLGKDEFLVDLGCFCWNFVFLC